MRPERHSIRLSAEKILIGQSGAQNINLASVGKLRVPLDDNALWRQNVYFLHSSLLKEYPVNSKQPDAALKSAALDPIKSYKPTERATGQREITTRRQRPRVHREVVSRQWPLKAGMDSLSVYCTLTRTRKSDKAIDCRTSHVRTSISKWWFSTRGHQTGVYPEGNVVPIRVAEQTQLPAIAQLASAR